VNWSPPQNPIGKLAALVDWWDGGTKEEILEGACTQIPDHVTSGGYRYSRIDDS
jgi:hypothetical protein